MGKHKLQVNQFSLDVLSSLSRNSASVGGTPTSSADKGSMLASYAKHSVSTPVSFGSGTDIGRMREHNEDSLFVAPPLFMVADGMGGHAAGEVASELAVQTISELAPNYPNGPMLAKAVEVANKAVYEAATQNEQRKGMGTTITAALLKGTRLIIAQVGDSRAYLLHQGVLQQLTRDHSLMSDMIDSGRLTAEEARVHPKRNYITRALGTGPAVKPDIYELNVQAGDRLLLCSDGLSGMIDDDEITRLMLTVKNPQSCVRELIASANAAGGVDNITAVVVDVDGNAADARQLARRKSIITAAVIGGVALLFIILALILIIKLLGS